MKMTRECHVNRVEIGVSVCLGKADKIAVPAAVTAVISRCNLV